MKLILLFFVTLLLTGVMMAQVGHGGQPSILPGGKLEDFVNSIREMPPLPSRVQQAAYSTHRAKGEALSFAHPFHVELTTENSGEWTILQDGTRVWRLGIRSRGAHSINLIFDRFFLVPGDSVFIFDPGQKLVSGAFTHLNNQPSGILATTPVPGHELIVELRIPAGYEKQSELVIGAINHDYLNLFTLLKSGRFGRSGSCNVNFTCLETGIWNQVGQSVSRIIVDGTELCTGTMLNNTRNDGRPFFLTAAHCLRDENSASTIIFYFNYQVPKCEGAIEGTRIQTLSGSFLRAYAETLDVALVEMSSMPPSTYTPYWAGWSLTQAPVSPVRAIHHPEGDVKKIAQSNSTPTESTFFASSYQGNPFVANSHWLVSRWHSGTTEPGSSGCPLFDNNGLVVGSLSGGVATCGNPVNDYFTRFNKAWDYFPEFNQQLAYWLDPIRVSPLSIQGFDYFNGAMERLSNFVPGDSPVVRHLRPGKGAWSGHNSLGIKSIAEMYTWVSSATIHGVYLVTAKSVVNSAGAVNLKIWSGVNEPSTLIASKNNISLGQLAARSENLVMLDAPVTAVGPLWIEVELDYSIPVDSFALYQSMYSATLRKNSAWLKNVQGEWISFEDAAVNNYPSSFWIDILASDVQKVDTSVIMPALKNMVVFPVPVCNNLNVQLDSSGTAIVEIFNMVGQQVKKDVIQVSRGEGSINLSLLGRGIYIMRLTINEQVHVEKIMVGKCNE